MDPKIQIDRLPDGIRIAAEGALGIAAAAELKAALVRVLEPGAAVEIDLARAASVDLTCLQVIVAAADSYNAAGARLRIVDGPGKVLARVAAAAAIPSGRITTFAPAQEAQ